MMMKIKCPECGVEGSLSLADVIYEGPYRCWKCRALFSIRIENDELKSCEPLSEEEFNRQQEIKALKDKLKRE
ncbi:hypothetical protein ACFLWY_02760 [Chloroflexota bacterium]